MFYNKEILSETTSEKSFYNALDRFPRFKSILKVGLLALLFQSPIYATDPIDVDPDPDHSTTIIVEASAEEETTASLPPGQYTVIVVDEDGSTETREIYKQ